MKFIHDRGKHNKFWSYETDSNHNVTVSWGRLGTKGQSKTFEFDSSWAAQGFAEKKVHEKKRKGYREVDAEVFGLKQVQAELIGAGCKIEELTFVKKLETDKNIYQSVSETSALADPSYEPLIYCSLLLTGKRGVTHLLIDTETVYSCWQMGSAKWLGEDGTFGSSYSYRLDDVEEIKESSDPALKKIRDKAPALVAALIK